MHPVVAQVMEEIGIDISAAKPKALDAGVLDGVDWVVGMGCGDECPFVPGAKRLDWDVADPSGQSLNEVRGIRNDVKRLVENLLAEVTGH